MKSKYFLIAKILILIFLACGLSSLAIGKKVYSDLALAKSRVSKLNADKDKLAKTQAFFESQIARDPAPVILNTEFTSLLLDLMKSRAAHGVTVGSIVTLKQGGDISGLSEKVAKTKLSFITLAVKGTYSSVDDFKSWLLAIQEHPVSVTRLNIDTNSYSMELKLYGS